MSLSEYTFKRVLNMQTIGIVINLVVLAGAVSTAMGLVGLFASGEWKRLTREMEEFESEKAAYVMTVVWAAGAAQGLSIGMMGLVFDVSFVFSNAVSVVA
ncbi:unnamed protein product [Linum tenue]|uniref:Uncharacterized protein n=1 Tax=Linum tenue TaxID=586396 RepID=A0AAV0KCL2_9ROSI|nr:unnamed protein product [Linum tenue]